MKPALLLRGPERCRRIVIKAGSALLVDRDTRGLKEDWLAALAIDIAELMARRQEVLIVSSGAIGLGLAGIELAGSKPRLEDRQAAAAIGQIRLAHAYQTAFATHDIKVAQILLTIEDMEDRRRYLNARNTIETLLKNGILPVINENDTVATSEIRFGDNDRLAARVAQMAGADCLILLSDIDGLYTADPNLDANAKRIEQIEAITREIEILAGAPFEGSIGSGGMITKISAAKTATQAGCQMVITDGRAPHPIRRYQESGIGTVFLAANAAASKRKQWLSARLSPAGAILIDPGAVQALTTGASLLPAGVNGVEGVFSPGDLIQILDAEKNPVGQGITAYSSEALGRIKGHKTHEIPTILGYAGREAVIHRDDLVLI